MAGQLPLATTFGPLSTILCSLVALSGNQHTDSCVLGIKSCNWTNRSTAAENGKIRLTTVDSLRGQLLTLSLKEKYKLEV